MKTILRIAVSIMLTYGLLTLTSCSVNTSDKDNNTDENVKTATLNDDQFEEDRTEVAEDLRELREDISQRIQRVGDRMENANEEARQDLSELNEQLLDERERVDEALERVESSTNSTWSDVREGARNTFQDVKRELGELGDRLSD